MGYTPQERVNGKGERIVAGQTVTITTSDGSRVTGTAEFHPSSQNTVVVRSSSGYHYHGDVRTTTKGEDPK